MTTDPSGPAIMSPWELSARERIRDTVGRYAVAGDGFRLDELAQLFTEDGVLHVHGSDRVQGRAAIVTMLGEHAQAGNSNDAAGFFVRHFVTNLVMQSITPTEGRTTAYFAVFTPDGPDHWGRYRDRFVPVGDRWLFQERVVRVDGSSPGGWYQRVFSA